MFNTSNVLFLVSMELSPQDIIIERSQSNILMSKQIEYETSNRTTFQGIRKRISYYTQQQAVS